MPAGFTVQVTAPARSAGVSLQEIFQVAIDDESRATEAVRIAALIAKDALVEITGKLSPTEIGWLSLEPGEVRSIRRTIPRPSERPRRRHRS